MAAHEVAVAVINWNSWRDTIESLESLKRTGYPAYRAFVVDNHSVDDSWDRLAAYLRGNESATKYTLIRNDENAGFAGGVNAAVLHAFASASSSPHFIFLLNNDARLQPFALSKCVEASLAEDAGIVGAVVRSEDGGKVLFAGSRFPHALFISDRLRPRAQRFWESYWVEASAVLVRADVVQRRLRTLGYFLDPDLFMYGEEIELCWWARNHGYRVLIAGEAIAYHRGGAAGGRLLSYYYTTRNRILLARRLLPWGWQVAFHCWYPLSRVLRAIQRCLGGRCGIAKAILFGLVDGYRSVGGKWRLHPDEHPVEQ